MRAAVYKAGEAGRAARFAGVNLLLEPCLWVERSSQRRTGTIYVRFSWLSYLRSVLVGREWWALQ